MIKKELRQLYLQKRKEMTLLEAEEQSAKIASQFFSFFDLDNIQSLHTFLPIPKKKEIDTWQLIRGIQKVHPSVEIIIPKVDPSTQEMLGFVYTSSSPLEINEWGIPEPVGNILPYPPRKIDMILLPLLVFDLKGNRVGYGKGFYDRYLKSCRNDVIKIGLSYFEAENYIEDISLHDVPLDYCVTPKKVYKFL